MNVNFGEMERDVISEKIANRLLTLIKERQLRPGDKLPPERELALLMKVSRPSLREALRALQMMNIIENRHGSGNYVTALEPERLVEHLDVVFALDASTYHDLFQARRVLESGIAEIAAMMITDEEVAGLESLLEHGHEVIDDSEAFMKADMDLHAKILEAAKNRIMPVFMQSINKISLMSRRQTGESLEVRRRTAKDHEEIILALKARDPQRAREAMTAHLTHIEDNMPKLSKKGG